MTRRLSLIAAILGGVGAVGLAGCELIFVGGAIYGAFHGPDPLSTAYVSLRRHDCSAANSEFSAVLATEPNDARAISGKADALVCLEKYDVAIADYSRAIELDPKWFDYLGRGVAYKAQGDQSQALRNFDEGIAINPTVPALYIYKGAVLNARGDASGAQADFEKVSSLISNQPEIFNRYGWTLATSPIAAYRDGSAAIQYSQRACELTSWSRGPVLDTLAAAYAEAGQFDEAMKWQTSAVQLDRDADKDYEVRLAMYRRREPFRSSRLAAWFF
ncbi:MAG: hypothetical protein WCE23_06880 [Candidatus Binatus sp.]|uniref:tetratricopeptide repeat protein n=1 Tax=Candidatus Binatus sp. TaxID=2811406 RepID=UPI003C7445C0